MDRMLLVIADDDSDAAEALAEMLRLCIAEPLGIVLACDGKEALAAATGLPAPDAVIMDIEMPRMNGFDAAVAIRHALGSVTPTLIAASGDVGWAGLAAASSAFDHALLKPIEVDELLGLLEPLRSK